VAGTVQADPAREKEKEKGSELFPLNNKRTHSLSPRVNLGLTSGQLSSFYSDDVASALQADPAREKTNQKCFL